MVLVRLRRARLSKKDVSQKVKDMEEARSFVYTPAVVKGMVEQKRQASGRPTNLLYERDRLRIAIAAAMDKQDEAEVQRLQQEVRPQPARRGEPPPPRYQGKPL